MASGAAAANGVMLLSATGGQAPPWGVRAGARSFLLPLGAIAGDAAALVGALAEVACVLIDADTLDALPEARRVHQADADVQVIIVAETEERRRTFERALLFAPGVGELWLASPGDVAGGIAERAAGVTRQRRKFRRTRERMARERVAASPQRAERALISEAYLANLLHVLPDPVFSVDAAGRILSANPAAAHLLPTPTPNLVGLSLDTALGTTDVASVLATCLSANGGASRAELPFHRRDGSTGYGELLVSRVAGSEPPYFAVVLHDLTERHEAQQQLEDQALELEQQAHTLQEQAGELEQTNDALLQQHTELETALGTRSRFYAAMSHELRTPINAVIGYTGLALEGIYGPLSDDLRDALLRSQRAAAHLRELVNDVLDLAKIEAGRIELEHEAVDATVLIEDILHSVRPAAESSGTSLVLDCDNSSVSLVTDPRRVRQILLNLLSNALKFGAGRPVIVRCARVPDGVAFHVVDHGPGVPTNEQHRIFEEFVQLDPQGHRGTGLGLPISRRLAELLRGSLTVVSAPGEGSVFTLTLPRS